MIVEMQVLSLLLFIGFFAAVTVRVVRRGAATYDHDARLPLENDHD